LLSSNKSKDGLVVEGKAFWCFLNEPNIQFEPQWSLRLVGSELEQRIFEHGGFGMRMEQLDGKDVGLSVLMKRKVKSMDDVLKKPILLDKNQNRLELFEELPNGSNVKVKYKRWERTHPFEDKVVKGIDLIAVMLLDETPTIF